MSLGKTVTYTGEILDCVKQGKGSYKYPGGVYTYEGPWVNGKKHGSKGKFSIVGGATYEGDFEDGEMTGKGTKTWADGRTYTGDFVNGELCGKGIWKSADGNEIYEGDFVDNRREGQGYNRLSNGDTYNGGFSRHCFHGPGSYLRENSFIVSSVFKFGISNGLSEINWHKVGSYHGDMTDGCMHGIGKYSAFNGSYVFDGEFSQNTPAYTVQKLHLFIDRSFISEEEVETKSKKKASKPKKGDPSADALATVSAGQELGKLIYLMDTDKSDDISEDAAEWKVPLSVPNTSELYRSMRVRLREYFPPSPPGKGQPPPEPDPDAELGAILPLWQRKPSQEVRSVAWQRFPVVNCIRYIDGVNILTGDEASIEGSTSSFSKGDDGIVSAKIPQSADSSISVTFAPETMKNCSERLTILADFKFALDNSTKFERTTVDKAAFDEVPILSLCNKVGGLEGRSRLELVLLKPGIEENIAESDGDRQSEAENKDGEPTPSNEPWCGCMWELHLCEEMEHIPDSDTVEDSGSVEEQNCDDKEDVDVDPPAPIFVQKKTKLCRWADSAAFDATSWHSIALTLQQCSSSGDTEAATENVGLTVDGTGRMKIDGPFEEGIAAAWLPGQETILPDDSNQSENAGEAPVCMVFRVGKGECFGGMVKSLVLISGKYGNIQEMTSVFINEANGGVEMTESIGESGDVNESVDDDEDEDEDEESSEPVVPRDCTLLQEVEFATCGGRGSVDGLLIPSTTPHGIYVLEVLDNVDPQCLMPNVGPESITLSPPLNPIDMAPMGSLVPAAGSSLMSYKIMVNE